MFIVLSKKRLPFKICLKLFSTSKVISAGVKNIHDPNFRIVFLGNDNFALQNLKVITELIPSKNSLSIVVSNQNNIVGKYAKSESFRSILWEDFKSKENQENFDIGVVASFGHLIPKRIIDKCHMGILNVHGSLLPKLRGAAPVSRAIINGETETGVSIMKIAPHRFDIGPILHREKCRIDPHVRAPELTSLLAMIGGQSLKKILLDVENVIDKLDTQSEEEATSAPKLTPDLKQINWEKCSSSQIYNLYRGLSGTYKTFTFYQGRKIDLDDFGLVFKGEPLERIPKTIVEHSMLRENTDFSQFYANPVEIWMNSNHSMWNHVFKPGEVFVEKNLVFVRCANNDWVFIRKVKIGTKWMSAKDFRNGFLSKSKGQQFFYFNVNPDASDDLERQAQ